MQRCLLSVILIALLILMTGCSLLQNDVPIVVIESPPSGSEFREGDLVVVQSTSIDPKGIVRVELVVDGAVVDVDPSPIAKGQDTFTVVQNWRASAGTHTLLVRAYNRSGAVSDPVAIQLNVIAKAPPTAAPPTLSPPQATLTTQPVLVASPTTATCTDNLAFVQDISIPDGTVLAANQTFTKIWRVRNSGSCAWGLGYQFFFVSGQAMTSTTVHAIPMTQPGGLADMQIPMIAPSVAGSYTGRWRMRNASGTIFGETVSVIITVPAAPTPTNTLPPAGCSGMPNISSFTTSASTIASGASATLNWGFVSNADSVEIDQGVGGVATPGSTNVTPTTTTTYTLTARCGGNSRTLQVTITVTTVGPVTSVSASVSPSNVTNANCASPQTFNFSGTVATNGATTVSYRWERSTGAVGSAGSITFSGAGSQTVADSWSMGSPGFSFSGWAKLHVTAPNDVSSGNANFSIACNP